MLCILMAFRWRADDGPLLVLFGSSFPLSKKQKKMLDPLWQNFLDPRMASNLWQVICYLRMDGQTNGLTSNKLYRFFTISNGGTIANETFYTKGILKSFIRFDEERCGFMFLVNVKFFTIDSYRKAFVNMNRT